MSKDQEGKVSHLFPTSARPLDIPAWIDARKEEGKTSFVLVAFNADDSSYHWKVFGVGIKAMALSWVLNSVVRVVERIGDAVPAP